MNDLFNGLLLYEVTLLILGIILFLILSAGLVYYIIKKEQIKKLLLFFIVPLVMIGYPSIKEITISKDRIALVLYQDMLVKNPEDSVARGKVEEITDKLEDRASSPEDMVQISKSYLLLGRNEKAVVYAEKALVKDNTNQKAQDLKQLVSAQEKVEELIVRQPVAGRDTARFDSIIQDVKVTKELSDLKPFLIRKTRTSRF